MAELELIGPLQAAAMVGGDVRHRALGVKAIGDAVRLPEPRALQHHIDSCLLRARASLAT